MLTHGWGWGTIFEPFAIKINARELEGRNLVIAPPLADGVGIHLCC